MAATAEMPGTQTTPWRGRRPTGTVPSERPGTPLADSGTPAAEGETGLSLFRGPRNDRRYTMKRVAVTTFALLLAALVSACSKVEAPQGPTPVLRERAERVQSGTKVPVEAEYLRDRAVQLAEAELAKMNAIELTYRNKPAVHTISNPAFFEEIVVYAKVYRNYTHYRIADIAHAESVLHPLSIDIEYDFEIIATRSHHSTVPNAEKEAKIDTVFRVLGRDTFKRHYLCDEEGKQERAIPDYLGRPRFFGSG